ncbi:MAG: DUF177 domain-containing protein [Candidatus Omnitrophica bacterium]|nr:DUF177 domain-containing protein [Candidatus Omnitrophota bacterium]
MKIRIAQVTPEGVTLEEDVPASELDLDTDTVKFPGTVNIKAEAHRITNVVSVSLNLSGMMSLVCSRCLKEFKLKLNKSLKLNYPVEKNQQSIDLSPDIREEIILDYPIQPLCTLGCKGLCAKCGRDLNSGKCNCGN